MPLLDIDFQIRVDNISNEVGSVNSVCVHFFFFSRTPVSLRSSAWLQGRQS
jgi:hypothetical protein